MDFLAIDYRNPAFSIAMLLIVIAAVATIDHLIGVFKRRFQDRKLTRFLSRFNSHAKSADYKAILNYEPGALYSLILLAGIYYKSGDYSETMKICLALLDIATDRNTRVTVMLQLARAYFKAGFLQRSRDILLESIRLRSRNHEALELLLIIYEQMREYKLALEVLSALRELGDDVSRETAFLEANQLLGDPFITESKRQIEAAELIKTSPFLARLLLSYLLPRNPKLAWECMGQEEAKATIDLFWNLPKEAINEAKAQQIPLLSELYTAKGVFESATGSSVFELDLLIRLGDNRAVCKLEFEYRCEHCQALYPVHFDRCPGCLTLGAVAIETVLSKNEDTNEDSANFY
ncbi:hypothetical protein AGMMS50229_11950 [Campylobacterota bacterium]|nr:hypothetical protein AGMMS50229_11950 [Campylobacterota bacterium]